MYFTHVYAYIYINMQDNTLELIPMKTILNKKIRTNETEKSRVAAPAKWMKILVLYSHSLEHLEMRKHGLVFKLLRLCSLPLISKAREGAEWLEDRASPTP